MPRTASRLNLLCSRNKYEDEVNSLKKKIKAIKVQQKKMAGGEVVLHKGEPTPESEVLEEKLVDSNKKLELMEKNAPELMEIKVGFISSLFVTENVLLSSSGS